MNTPPKPPILQVWWVLWAAFLGGIFMFYTVLGGQSTHAGTGIGEPFGWALALGGIGASVVIRWVILPQIATAQRAFTLFIVGIALAEGPTFFGLFLLPTRKLEFLLLSALGIFQFIPLFAGRFYSR